MSSHRTICPLISLASSTDGGAGTHARAWLVAALIAVAALASVQLPDTRPNDAAGKPLPSVNYGKLPLSFEANQGQSSEQVKFLARGPGYSLFLTPAEAVLSLRASAPRKRSAAERAATGKRVEADETAQPVAVVRMRLVGANKQPQLAGLDPLPGTSNYFIGSDPARWQRDVPNYARVKYASVYPGIDLVYYGNQRQLEYDLVVAPGADPRRIALGFEGVRELSIDPEGNLVLQTSQGAIAQHKPIIYQDIGGKRQAVDGRYVLGAKHRVGFQVAGYDTTRPLVIDPVLSYSTYLGGNGNDIGYAIAVDSAGSAYVTGLTQSTNFPGASASPIQPISLGSDAFVTKLNAAGSALVYSTYLGGSNGDTGYAIAVDSLGNAYVTGETDSGTQTPTTIPFPTAGAFQVSYKGGGDAFITKINAAGNALVYSTYLGGSGNERGYGIAVDSSFNAYVTGHTSTNQGDVPGPGDFPTAVPFQAQNGSPLGNFDAFVTKINPAGSALVYSTFLGGNFSEFSTYGGAIAVDSNGNAYVGGTTASTNFPEASTSTIQPTYGGGTKDGFVVKFNAAGSALLYSTYLGGNNFYDEVNGIAIDSARNAYVVGYTDALDFPTALPLQATKNGFGNDAFVSKINATGSALVYSTYLGGSNGDIALAVAVDSGGNANVSGWTASSNFPTVAPFQASAGSGDAFISKFNAVGSALLRSTYLGGSTGSEIGYGIALDSLGNAYVTGQTSSTNFPTAGPIQAAFGGGGADAFVAKLTLNNLPTLGSVTPSALTSAPAAAQTFSAIYSDPDGYANLKQVGFLVNTAVSGANGIYLLHDRTVNKLYLYTDAGTGFVGNCTPGVAGSLTNAQGTLNCAATTVSGSGNNLTVNWNITPKAAFVSATTRNLYLYARDMSNASVGWIDRGDWRIKATNVAPTLGTVTPSVLTSAPGIAQTFSAVYVDADGYGNLKQVFFFVPGAVSGADDIYLLHDRTVNKLYLVNDAGTGYVGSCTPGVAGSLTNTQGTLNCGATTVSGSGNYLLINWNITPKAAFVSPITKGLYLYARDMSNASVGWIDRGDWRIKATNVAPTLGTVTPSVLTSAPGIAREFSAVYSDADGYGNLKQVYFLVSTTGSGVNGIYLRHERTLNKLYLYNDAGTGYVGNCTPGVAGSLTNTQGTLNCAATTVGGSGNYLLINWNITPKAAFVSATKRNIYLYARDMSNLTAGWTDKGDWTIKSPAPLGDAYNLDVDGDGLVNAADIDGDERVIGAGVDIGADEYDAGTR